MDEVYNRKAGNIQMIQNASRQYAYDIMGIDAAKTAKNILEGQD